LVEIIVQDGRDQFGARLNCTKSKDLRAEWFAALSFNETGGKSASSLTLCGAVLPIGPEPDFG